MRKILLFFLLALLATPQAFAKDVKQNAGKAPGQDALRMLYFPREPYYLTGPAGPEGILVNRTNIALAEAGLIGLWQEANATRIVEIIRNDLEPACSPGWFMTEERAAQGRFADAVLYSDPPMGLLVRRNSPLMRIPQISEILADPALRLLVKKAFSYGKTVDELIGTAKAQVMVTNARNSQLARMIAGGRADMMFITAEEGRPLIEADAHLANLTLFAPAGLTGGQKRHVWCSKSVDAGLVDRLSAAIAKLYPETQP